MNHELTEVHTAQIYAGHGLDDWVASVTIFGDSYNYDIGEVKAFGSYFENALTNLISVLQDIGFDRGVVLEGLEGEQYGELYMSEDKPKLRLCYQVDWANHTGWMG